MLKLFLLSFSTPALLLTPKKGSNQAWIFLPPILALFTFLSLQLIFSPSLTSKTHTLFLLDTLSTPLISLTLWISALMFLSSTTALETESSSLSTWILILATTLLLAFSVDNMILFYISFESTLIPTTMLILGWGYQPERLQASLYFIMYTVLASLPLLISILFIHSHFGHLSFSYSPNLSPTLPHSLPWIWVFSTTAFLVKLPLFLLHLWLPKAHVEAPIAGSMILAAILLKLGGYGLIRMTAMTLPPAPLQAPPIVSSIALWGALTTALICLRQMDIKAMIAYSSIGHMALMIAGTLSLSSVGIAGANMMMIAHGLTSSAMFTLANMAYEKTNTRSIFITKGLSTIAPHMTLWWFLATAANLATPPSLNLLSEIFLISSILAWSPLSWLTLALITTLNAAYALYLFTATQHGQSPKFLNPLNTPAPSSHTNLTLHLLPLLLLSTFPETLTAP